ncbi:MAG: hypothetical protein ACPHL6_09685 [Rubripirellula sp.]
MFKRISFILYLLKSLTLTSSSAELPESDPRQAWRCAYPYTETTCQSVLLSWAKDHDTPWETIFAGSECSGCEPHYVLDRNQSQHLTYAECKNRFGANFTSQDLIAPIVRYRESSERTPGWSVTGWRFRPCFETWQCSQYCSLTQYPPQCIKYKSTNWGLYQPTVDTRCEDHETPTPPSEIQPPSESSVIGERDKTWFPTH